MAVSTTSIVRVGLGYDIHRLTEGRRLILGGVEIPFGRGLLGHSDGDVLLHAVADAMLGAAGLPDIGETFPDTDPAYRNANSRYLLARVVEIVRRQGFHVANADVTVHAEAPNLSAHKQSMTESIARVLGVDRQTVSVKAKSSEGLGPVGAGDAIACTAVVALRARTDDNASSDQ